MIDFDKYQVLFADFLQKNHLAKEPYTLYEPADYILSLGGKRLRPLFVLLGCELYGQKAEKALQVAFAIEVFHNFTLMHDDIMDLSDIRRGKPTVHKKYNLNTAILTGDVMLIKAYHYLTDQQDHELVPNLLKEFNKMAIEVCEGQQYDVDFEIEDHVKIDDYLHMITLKTSVLFACALKLGSVIGGASAYDSHHMYEFAKNYGIAFQLQDDYLDVFGKGEEVGKAIGGDIIKNKKTYLYLKSLELCDQADRDFLISVYRPSGQKYSDAEKVSLVTQIFAKNHVAEYSKQLIEVYRDLAYSHLTACHINENHKEQIMTFMNDLLFRQY